ncbi:MAG: hypothetical protein U0798_06150 [Gemmataceae bacterium]
MVPRLLAIFLVAVFATPLFANPHDDVLSHIPPRTAVCIVVRDLSAYTRQLAESPFAGWFAKTELGQTVRMVINPEKKAEEFEQTLIAQFGLTPEEILNDIFGDAVAFAYSPGPPEQSLILIKPRKPNVAAQFLSKLDNLQTQAKELESVSNETHRNVKYTARKKKDGTTEAYLIENGILAFASDDASLKSYIDSRVDKVKPAPVADSLAQLKIRNAFATVWFDPRAFDASFAEQVKKAPEADRVTMDSMARIWSAVDHFAIHADLNENLQLHISTRLNNSKLPSLVSGILPFQAGQTSLWSAIPPDALVAVAGRFAVASMLSKADQLSKTANQKPLSENVKTAVGGHVGHDKFQAVIEALGPDWGLWINAPEQTDTWTPDWTFAIRIRPDPAGKVDTAAALMQGVESAAFFARLTYNQSHAEQPQLELKDLTIGDLKIRSFVGKSLPPGLRPSFAIRGEYFIFASTAERIAKFSIPAADAGMATESPLIRISGTGLRSYLKKNSAAITQAIATIKKQDADDVKSTLDQIVRFLEPIERVEVTAVQNDGLTRMSFTLMPTKSLKK